MLNASVSFKNKILKVRIPTGWHEVTWGQYLQLLKPLKLTEILSIFIGIPHKELLKAKIQGLEPLLIALNFVGEGMDISENPIVLGQFKLPKDLTLESVEQYWMIEDRIKKASEEQSIEARMKYLANYAAIYCQALNEEFDNDKAEELAKTFNNYPCLEVLSAGSFFLLKLTSIEKNLPMSYLLTLTRWKNLQPVMKSSGRHLGTTPPSIRSRATSRKMTKRSQNGA